MWTEFECSTLWPNTACKRCRIIPRVCIADERLQTHRKTFYSYNLPTFSLFSLLCRFRRACVGETQAVHGNHVLLLSVIVDRHPRQSIFHASGATSASLHRSNHDAVHRRHRRLRGRLENLVEVRHDDGEYCHICRLN